MSGPLGRDIRCGVPKKHGPERKQRQASHVENRSERLRELSDLERSENAENSEERDRPRGLPSVEHDEAETDRGHGDNNTNGGTVFGRRAKQNGQGQGERRKQRDDPAQSERLPACTAVAGTLPSCLR